MIQFPAQGFHFIIIDALSEAMHDKVDLQPAAVKVTVIIHDVGFRAAQAQESAVNVKNSLRIHAVGLQKKRKYAVGVGYG